MTGGPETLARADGVLGEVALRRRPGPVYELIVNGVFLMDTTETSTEQLLGELVLAHRPTPRRVLVAGLGLGCTLAALVADPRPEHVDVVEIEPLLVQWLRAGLVPAAGRALADPRVRVRVADVRDALQDAGPYDAIVLDVDNGPGFLVHDRNAGVYSEPVLAATGRALAPGGLLLVWSADPAPELAATLDGAVGPVEHLVRWITREGRKLDYHIYLATREPECT